MKTRNITKLHLLLFLSLLWLSTGCTKEKYQVNKYVLGEVPAAGYFPGKSNLKSDLQFISIAYSDLFSEQIQGKKLSLLMDGYNACGDKQIYIDRLLKNMLKDPSVLKPEQTELISAPETFIRDTYRRFLVREPNESELWYIKKLMAENPELTAAEIYYAFMSSEEYKYY